MPNPKQMKKRLSSDKRPRVRTGGSPRLEGGTAGFREIKMGIDSATTIDFVIDYSRSMKDILPTIYIFCRDLMNACKLGSGRIRFGITFFSDEVTKKIWKNEDFTELPTDVLDGLLAREIGGGSRDRRENIGQAVRYSLEKLKKVPAGERVLILFTDTPPQDMELANCWCETPIRSAVLFVPVTYTGSEYIFQMVDDQGRPMKSRTSFVFDIEEVIRSRYLKISQSDGEERILKDNTVLRNQLLMALS